MPTIKSRCFVVLGNRAWTPSFVVKTFFTDCLSASTRQVFSCFATVYSLSFIRLPAKSFFCFSAGFCTIVLRSFDSKSPGKYVYIFAPKLSGASRRVHYSGTTREWNDIFRSNRANPEGRGFFIGIILSFHYF